MKVTCIAVVAVLCIGAAIAIDNVVSGNQEHQAKRSGIGFNGASSKSVNQAQHGGKDARRSNSGHVNSLGKASYGKNQGAAKINSGFAHLDNDASSALYDNLANNAAQEAVKAGYAVYKDGRLDQNNINNKAGFNQASAKKNSFNRGKVLNDNISYGFDKKFNKHTGEKGGFEEELGSNSHKLDEFRDRQRALNFRRGNHAANFNKANAKKALRESNFDKHAAQKAAQNSKYANKDNRLDRAQQQADLQDVKFDKKDKRFKASQKGKDESVRKFDDFAVKDAQFNRNEASAANGKKGEAAERFYKDAKHGKNGIASAPHRAGHTSVNLHGAPRRSGANVGQSGGNAAKNSALYGEAKKHLQNANNHNARKAGKHAAALNDYQRAKDLIDRDEVKSLRDSRRGNLKNAVHRAENGGFNNNNAVAAKTAHSKNRQFADAAAKNTASQAKKDLDEAKFDKENSKRVLSDRNKNQRKLKRFFHDKLEGGNNFERLNFNRKRIESDFGNQQQAAAQSGKKFNKASSEKAFSADRRKDENVAAKSFKGNASKRNRAQSKNGHTKKSNSQVAKTANSNAGFKNDVAQKNYNNNNLASSQSKQGIQQQFGRGNAGVRNQHVGGTHGNGGFNNFGNFHSFGNNGFGSTPVRHGQFGGFSSGHSLGFGSGSIGFGANPHGNFAGARFAPLNKQCYKDVDLSAGYHLSSSNAGYPSQQINEEINNRPSMARLFNAPQPSQYSDNGFSMGSRFKRMASFASFGQPSASFGGFGFQASNNQCPAEQSMLRQFTKFGGSCYVVSPETQKIMFNKCSSRDCPNCPSAQGTSSHCMESYGWVNVYAFCENINSSEKIRPLRLYLPTGCGAQSYSC